MGEIALTGALVLGPAWCLQTPATFPAGEVSIPLLLAQNEYIVASNNGLMNVTSPSAYVPIPCVGTAGPVTHGTLLYVRTSVPLLLRLTTTAGVSVLPVNGLLVLEFNTGQELTLLETQGTGTLEYLVAGQS